MTARGIGLVARQEFRTRLRTGRWRWLLGLWALVVAGSGVLLRLSFDALEGRPQGDGAEWGNGVPMFGGLMLFVLTLVMLVAPALTSQSVNGDRERGTLATLQVTRLTPGEIALGKFAAAWGTALVVLGVTLPVVAWPVIEGAISVGRAAIVLAIVAVLMGSTCAMSQALSSLVARGVTSSMLSYLVTFGLMVGTVVVFTLTLPLTQQTTTSDGGISYRRTHQEYVWWLLAPNPFVVLADATPAQPDPPDRGTGIDDQRDPPTDPLKDIKSSVRDTRDTVDSDGGSVWPYGLGFHLVMLGGSLWVTTRRLRTPVRGLPRAVRLA